MNSFIFVNFVQSFVCCSIFKDHRLTAQTTHLCFSSTAYILYHTRFRLSRGFLKYFQNFLIFFRENIAFLDVT